MSHEDSPRDDIDESVFFRLVRYNPRRKMRGAEAAELEVGDADNSCVLWMSVADLKNNVKEYGPHPALLEALDAYRMNTEIEWRGGIAKT